jgi:hypothetical protein
MRVTVCTRRCATLRGWVAASAWFIATVAFLSETARGWLDLVDSRLVAQAESFGGIGLLIIGLVLLRAFWRVTEPAEGARLCIVAGLMRVVMGLCWFVLGALDLSIAVNARPAFGIATGADSFPGGEVRLLAEDNAIEVSGPLSVGIAQRFHDILHSQPGIAIVHLESPGGWAREGMLLARLIEQNGLSTYSATGCASACVIAFSAGDERTLAAQARLGFHSSAASGADPLFVSHFNDRMGAQLKKLGASPEFVAQAFSTPATSLWCPEPELLLENGIVTSIPDGNH